jgi:UDP-2,4-diacetamido-2,4,6-trideoxy-beta-L-altropyranose hydrolase
VKIAFRVDASAEMGSGHLMRCLALADALRARGTETLFVTSAAERPWRSLLRQHGHAVAAMPNGATEPDRDALETRSAFNEMPLPDWLVVDHYGLGIEWESSMRASCGRIFAIDDVGRSHDCDLLLDQNVLDDEHAYEPLVPRGCSRLLGPRYALLREEFGKERANGVARDGPVKRVLINFGGSDPTQEIGMTLKAFLAAPLDESVCADVILGPANLNADTILRRYGSNRRLNLLSHTERMAALMAEADLAIGAGGMSMWERACSGLPSIVVTVADNQRAGAECLAAQGGHLLLGASTTVTAQHIAQALGCLAGNSWLRALFARTGAALVDGRGRERVAGRLLGGEIALRPATSWDCDALYAWRNAEINRRYSGDDRMFSIEAHRQWFADMSVDPSRIMLIGEANCEPIGVLRFDLKASEAMVSIYLVPGRHGMGWGESLLDSGAEWLRAHRPEIVTIRARVKTGNHASLAVFGRAGYLEQERTFSLSLHSPNTP